MTEQNQKMGDFNVGGSLPVIRSAATSSAMRPNTSGTNPRLYSPFTLETIRHLIPNETGLKTGFYNSIALIFLLLVLIVIYYCYWILKPFLQALVWALLCGSALHPFKQRLYICSNNWIRDMKTDGRPITVSTVFLPFNVINKSCDLIITYLLKYRKIFGLFIVSFLLQCFGLSDICFQTIYYYVTDNTIVNIFSVIFCSLLSLLTNSNNTLVILSVIIGYLIGLSFCWSKTTESFLTVLAPFVWISLFIHIIALSGTFGYLLSLILVIITSIGIIKTISTKDSTSIASHQIDGLISLFLRLKNLLYGISTFVISTLFKDDESEDSDDNQVNEQDTSNEQLNEQELPDTHDGDCIIRRTSLISNTGENGNKSNLYLCAVLWSVVFVQICWRPKLLLLGLIPASFKLLTIGSTYVSNIVLQHIQQFQEYIEKRKNALIHPLMRNAFNYFIIGDKVIIDVIESSLNSITSLTIICVTIVSVLFFGVFLSIQVYGESLHLVNSVSNILNNTIHYYPESSQLLPKSFQGVDGMLDEMVKNGYEYGRQYIKNSVQNALNVDGNVTKTIIVEKQILEIWDRAYHLWLIRNSNDTGSMLQKGPYDYAKLWNAFKSLDFYLGFNILKENIDILLSVLDSLWLVLKGNVSLLFSAIAAVFSILLGGGLGLMNLGLSFIIFTTALFYLLSASGKYYKPIELVNKLFPSEVTQQPNSCFTRNKFGRAVEEAINGVFAASLKMSAFYGLYTFLIHILFEVNIVYIPSVMAAVFGAVPFLSAFWASFPAFLDLFFGQSLRTKAVLLLISAYFPSFFVDSTIYGEIKSAGHPYLTGLAIAGGVFYLGFEGAVIGPILLCLLFVAFNIYTSIMEESPLTTPEDIPKKTPLRQIHNYPQFRRMQSNID